MIDWEGWDAEQRRNWQRTRHALGIDGKPEDDTPEQLRAQLDLVRGTLRVALIELETLRGQVLKDGYEIARWRAQAEARQERPN